MTHPLFIISIQTPGFDTIAPMKYQINAKINLCGKVTSFSEDEDWKTTMHVFFYVQHKGHQAEIWSEIIISSIKRNQKRINILNESLSK